MRIADEKIGRLGSTTQALAKNEEKYDGVAGEERDVGSGVNYDGDAASHQVGTHRPACTARALIGRPTCSASATSAPQSADPSLSNACRRSSPAPTRC